MSSYKVGRYAIYLKSEFLLKKIATVPKNFPAYQSLKDHEHTTYM